MQVNFDQGAAPAAREGYSLLPEGTYTARISDCGVSPTKAGDGTVLKLELTVLDDRYTGRKVWDRMNVQNKNATAQQIAQAQLANLKRACGLAGALTDTNMLMDKVVNVRVIVKKQEPGSKYKDQNEVFDYLETTVAQTQPQARFRPEPLAQKYTPPEQSSSTAPWAKQA